MIKNKKISLDDVKKNSEEEKMRKAIENSRLPYDVSNWFLEKINFYNWNGNLDNPKAIERINKIFDENIYRFYDDFTRDFKKMYKDKIFKLFSEETKKILFRKINKVYMVMETILYEDMKRRVLSEINFQMGVADYISEDVLDNIVTKVSKDYQDRINLVNSGSDLYLNYPKTLKIYFKGYLFSKYMHIVLYNSPDIFCWYKEGWGLMTWIYKINGSGNNKEIEPAFFVNLYEAFIKANNKKSFFEFMKKEKEIEESQLKKIEFLENARKYLEKGGNDTIEF